MQQELIEMLEKMVDNVVFCNGHDQRFTSTNYGVNILKEAEALVEKAKNSAKEHAVPQGEPVYQLARATGPVADAWIDVAKDVYDDAGFHPSDFKRRILYAAPSQPVTLTDEDNRALQVMRWIDSGEWTLKKSRPSSLLTDEANAERAWFVERQAEPYCDNKGNRRWFGCTAFEAFTIAIAALRKKEQTK